MSVQALFFRGFPRAGEILPVHCDFEFPKQISIDDLETDDILTTDVQGYVRRFDEHRLEVWNSGCAAGQPATAFVFSFCSQDAVQRPVDHRDRSWFGPVLVTKCGETHKPIDILPVESEDIAILLHKLVSEDMLLCGVIGQQPLTIPWQAKAVPLSHVAPILCGHSLNNIMQRLPLRVVAQIMGTSTEALDVGASILRGRVLKIFSVAFTKTGLDKFFECLQSTRSYVFGDFALAVSMVDYAIEPREMFLATPRGVVSEWVKYFSNFQWQQIGGIPVLDGCISSRAFVKERRGCVVARVVLLESSVPDGYYPILFARYSAYMTFLSHDMVYAMYDELVSEGVCIVRADALEDHDRSWWQARGLRPVVDTSSLGRPCGLDCPALWRRLRGARGIVEVPWGGLYVDGTEVLDTLRAAYGWRLATACVNPLCARALAS